MAEAKPIATPITSRETTRTSVSGATALASAPTMKTAAEAMIVTRRPYWSESRPAASAPKAAPIGTALTTNPCSKLPSPKSPRMKSIALAMIPVS